MPETFQAWLRGRVARRLTAIPPGDERIDRCHSEELHSRRSQQERNGLFTRRTNSLNPLRIGASALREFW
jgi:hypothetical protein